MVAARRTDHGASRAPGAAPDPDPTQVRGYSRACRLCQRLARLMRCGMLTPMSTLRRIQVWDLPTRLFHWTLVLLVVASLASGIAKGRWMDLHFWCGYGVLTLLIFRVIWGFVGSRTARFADFIRGPGAALHHVRELVGPGKPQDLGHNPLGGWMVVVLLLILTVQAGTGLFADDDIFTSGPLANLVDGKIRARLTTIHRYGELVIPALIALHVAAIFVYRLLKRIDLVRPMLDGHKTVPPTVAAPALVSPLRAVLGLAVAGVIVWRIVALGS